MQNEQLIIDVGSSFTKVGLSRYQIPSIIRTPELYLINENSEYLFKTNIESDQLYKEIRLFLKELYFNHVRVSPQMYNVILLENDYLPKMIRNIITSILLKEMLVPKIEVLSSMLAPLSLCRIKSAIVIDIGYYDTRILAVFNNYPLYNLYKIINVGSFHVNSLLKTLLLEEYKESLHMYEMINTFPNPKIDLIKESSCYVMDNVQIKLKENKTVVVSPSTKIKHEPLNIYRFQDKSNIDIMIPEHIRWKPCEILFDSNFSNVTESIVDSVMQQITSCPIDVVPIILHNIVLCGGCVNLKGFIYRFGIELKDKILKSHTLMKLDAINKIHIFTSSHNHMITQWQGALELIHSNENNSTPRKLCLTDFNNGTLLYDWLNPTD